MSKIRFQVHCGGIGWMDPSAGDMGVSGTVGLSVPVEAFRITELDIPNSGIDAKGHVQDMGWSEMGHLGQDIGSTGLGKHLEAIIIGLTGEAYNSYDIWYRVHVRNVGWMAWAKNGEMAGTVGGNLQIEALQITVRSKQEYFDPNSQTESAFLDLTPKPQVLSKEDPVSHAMQWLNYIPEDQDNSIFGSGPYCCWFVNFICQECNLVFPDTGSCPDAMEWAINNGRFTDTPAYGYAVMFDFNSNGTPDHTGFFIEDIDGTRFRSIEANTSDQSETADYGVHIRERYYGSVLGFINPY